MLTVIIGLIFMGSFAFYVYKVMFMSNTSFEADYVHLYIKSETTFNQFIEQVDPFLLNIDNFSVLAKRKKYTVRPCLLYTSPSPRDRQKSRMPSSA